LTVKIGGEAPTVWTHLFNKRKLSFR